MSYERRAGIRKPVHVWLKMELIEKVRAENANAKNDSTYYRYETMQDTYDRIIGAFFEPAKRGKGK